MSPRIEALALRVTRVESWTAARMAKPYPAGCFRHLVEADAAPSKFMRHSSICRLAKRLRSS